MMTVPTEMWESLTGITIVHKRLLPDTGGHGEARGGLGQEIEFRNDTGAPLTAFCIAPRSEFPARDLFGGGDGSRRTILIDGRAVHPKGAHTVAPGQRFTMRDAGGGGAGQVLMALVNVNRLPNGSDTDMSLLPHGIFSIPGRAFL